MTCFKCSTELVAYSSYSKRTKALARAVVLHHWFQGLFCDFDEFLCLPISVYFVHLVAIA